MSAAEEAARKRREKILARGQDRMKYVSGEIKVLEEDASVVASPSAPTPATPTKPAIPESSPVAADVPQTKPQAESEPTAATTAVSPAHEAAAAEVVAPATPVDTRPRWEREREKNVSAVKETREISQATLESLKKTEAMAVEAPRAEKTVAARSISVQNAKSSFMPQLKFDSLLASLVAVFLGVMSGSTQGAFVQDNVWLPMGSFLLFALLMRVVLSASFSRLGLIGKKQDDSASSGGLIDMAVRFLPPVVKGAVANFRAVSGYMKDSYDDMMLFIFAHGVSSRLAMVKA